MQRRRPLATKKRLASVSTQLSNVEAQHRQLEDQVEELSRKNSAVKAEYDTLRERYRCQDLEFRRVAERGLQLLKSIMRMKIEAAEHRNEKNERVRNARVSKELRKATRRPVGIEIEP
uniref:Uncharacterized protein n=1 Tax=Sphaerodactylus townsendi TaxID=933632 RepID=A0ACB8FFC0_9SAUR